MELFQYWVMTGATVSSIAGVASLLIAFRVMSINTRHVVRIHEIAATRSGRAQSGMLIKLGGYPLNASIPYI